MTPDDLAFLGLRLHDGGGGADLAITTQVCTPFGSLYGGTGIAACAAVAEAATGRPLVWITTQFLGNAGPDEHLALEVEVPVAARSTSQAVVRASVGDRPVLLATTAHTDRDPGEPASWGEPPDVPRPEACEPFVFPAAPVLGASFMDELERRVPAGWREEAARSGRVAMWTRLPGWPAGSPAWQAFVADIVPMAITTALGREPGATSLDNTLRVVQDEVLPAGAWVLLDIEAQGFRRSIGHGQVRLWREDGALLGVASQTCIIRTSHHPRDLRPSPQHGT